MPALVIPESGMASCPKPTPGPVGVPDDRRSETVFVAGPGLHWLPAVSRQANLGCNRPSAATSTSRLKGHIQSLTRNHPTTRAPFETGTGRGPSVFLLGLGLDLGMPAAEVWTKACPFH